jgi:hypothetical protein
MLSFELEVVGYTISLAYCLHKGLPFSAYGELLFLLIQGALMFHQFVFAHSFVSIYSSSFNHYVILPCTFESD